MELEARKPETVVPSYSLTGDLLSYERCRLQYRYHNGSSLPPSRPIQLWFGEFMHQSLEMCYQWWLDCQGQGAAGSEFPWPCKPPSRGMELPDWEEHDIGRFGHVVEEALRSQGKQARSEDTRRSAYRRLEAAVNLVGPHLFPLISSAELRVIGTRPVPHSNMSIRCEQYQIHGVIDVLTNVTLSSSVEANPIASAIQKACPGLEGEFEVIVDYKGSRRPRTADYDWQLGAWQILTYAWLREQQRDLARVGAGILIYINELIPGGAEMRNLKEGIEAGDADVVPVSGSKDERIVRLWKSGSSAEQLSLAFRLNRAIRVVSVTPDGIASALESFDDVVRRAEEDIAQEARGANILSAWSPNCGDAATCVACDFRYFCPAPTGTHELTSPLG